MNKVSRALHCDICPSRDTAACAPLDDEQRAELSTFGREHSFTVGETIFPAGEPNEQCAMLIEGLLKVVDRDAEGVERIVGLIYPAGFVGELFTPVAQYDITALTPARLCLFDQSRYEDMAVRHAELAWGLARQSMAQLTQARMLAGMVGRRTAKSKLAALLTTLFKAAELAQSRIVHTLDLPLSREEIAALLGVKIETVSRQFSQLEKDGILRRAGKRIVLIDDPDRLAQLAA